MYYSREKNDLFFFFLLVQVGKDIKKAEGFFYTKNFRFKCRYFRRKRRYFSILVRKYTYLVGVITILSICRLGSRGQNLIWCSPAVRFIFPITLVTPL